MSKIPAEVQVCSSKVAALGRFFSLDIHVVTNVAEWYRATLTNQSPSIYAIRARDDAKTILGYRHADFDAAMQELMWARFG